MVRRLEWRDGSLLRAEERGMARVYSSLKVVGKGESITLAQYIGSRKLITTEENIQGSVESQMIMPI